MNKAEAVLAFAYGHVLAECRLLGFLAFLLTLAICIGNVVYNLHFHPLRSYPGPWFARASRIPILYYQVTGRLPQRVRRWHERFGSTIRVAPNDLSFTQSQAWFDIHGHRTGTKTGWFERDPSVYPPPPGAPSIFYSNEQDHSMFRRLLSHAFSAKALREQQPSIQSHIDLLISQLHTQIDGPNKGVVDISSWLNFITFDIIGELAFGEPFYCLKTGVAHPWVKVVFSAVRDKVYIAALSHLPKPFIRTIAAALEYFMLGDLRKHTGFTVERVAARITQGTERKDFISPILQANDEKGMTTKEIETSINSLIVAGSESTSTALSGTLYHLVINPHALQPLLAELRSAFPSRNSVTASAVQNLAYLNAVLEESLRVYPPTAFSHARIVPPEGAVICGQPIPGGTSVGVATWAASFSEQNWTEPNAFKPERWLGDGWVGDDQNATQPWLLGARGCLGKNLAYVEMRLILTQLLLEFEFELCEESREWKRDQRIYLLWEKPPLKMRLRKYVTNGL